MNKRISRDIIAKNIKALRLALGLSQLNFGILVGLSKPTIINIESAKRSYTLDLLDRIVEFTDYSLSELSSESFVPNTNIREDLAKKYEGQVFYKILNDPPEIVFAIRQKLLKSKELDTPKEIKQIRLFFESLGWYYKGTSISNALKRMPDKIKISEHDNKKNAKFYSKVN